MLVCVCACVRLILSKLAGVGERFCDVLVMWKQAAPVFLFSKNGGRRLVQALKVVWRWGVILLAFFRLFLLIFLYWHSFLISSYWGYITHKNQIKAQLKIIFNEMITCKSLLKYALNFFLKRSAAVETLQSVNGCCFGASCLQRQLKGRALP